MWGSSHNILKAMFYLLQGDYIHVYTYIYIYYVYIGGGAVYWGLGFECLGLLRGILHVYIGFQVEMDPFNSFVWSLRYSLMGAQVH